MNETEQLSPAQLIKTIFEPLIEQDKSLPSRITQYILQGDELNVLIDFDKLCQIPGNANKIYELLRGPAGFSSFNIHPSLQARIDFYKIWTDAYTPEQIIRFARVVATLFEHLHFIECITEKLPKWFICLLYDGLLTTLPHYELTTLSHYGKTFDKIDDRENWSIQQLHQFLEIEQAGLGENLLFAIFDRQNIFESSLRDFKYFTRLNGLLIYIQEHIELFKQLPSLGLALLGQLEQLKYIQRYPELQLQLVDFLAMQALNTSKQVNQLATEILLNLPLELVQSQLQHFLTSCSVKERSNAAVLLARIIADPVILQRALASETNKTVIATIENALSRLETANIAKQQADLVIPDFEPISDTPLPITARDILQQNFQEFLIECKKEAQEEIEANKKDGLQRVSHKKDIACRKKLQLRALIIYLII